MELMKKYGTWYVPTITAGKSVADSAAPTNGYRLNLGVPGPAEGIITTGPTRPGKPCDSRWPKTAQLRSYWKKAEIRAVVETARDLGLAVACHAHGAEGMKRAVRAGVTSIEHGTLMDDETSGALKYSFPVS